MSASESATTEEPMQTTFEMEEPAHLGFETGADDQPIVESSQHPEWFSQQQKPPNLDRDWNKTLPATHGSIQPWISKLAKQSDTRSSLNELMDTPMDFSNILINRLNVDTLTPELLAGPTYELLKGSCKSMVELEYHLEEVYKATIDQLDWESARDVYSKQRIIVVTELKIVEWHNYKHLDWITVGRDDYKLYKFKEGDFKRLRIQDFEDMLFLLVQRKLTNLTVEERFAFNIQEHVGYDKHALWGISHWGRKRQQFYDFAVNRESACDVYSKCRIIAVTKLKIVEWYNYKNLDWITVRRDNDKLYMFKEGDFKRFRIQDIEDMLLLLDQGKLTNLTVKERFAFNVSLRMFTRSIVIQRRVEDLQLGVESYQKKLNLTRSDTDGMLTDVRTVLDDRLKGIRMKYLPQNIWRKSDKERAAAMIHAIDKQLKT
nr:hypothetical protein [Tanacetum cinerariifolium]